MCLLPGNSLTTSDFFMKYTSKLQNFYKNPRLIFLQSLRTLVTMNSASLGKNKIIKNTVRSKLKSKFLLRNTASCRIDVCNRGMRIELFLILVALPIKKLVI